MLSKNDAFMFTIRTLMVGSFITSILATYGPFHILRFDQGPYFEMIFGHNCSDIAPLFENGTSAHGVNETNNATLSCNSEINQRQYSLWAVYDNFFFIENTRAGGGLCGKRSDSLFGNITGPVEDILTGNIGDCDPAALRACMAFTTIAVIFSALSVLWITVLNDHSNLHKSFRRSVRVLAFTNALCLASSSISMIVYATSINPLRLKPTFCQGQSLFSTCQQTSGAGMWTQVATIFLCLAVLLLGMAWKKWGDFREDGKELASMIEDVNDHDLALEEEKTLGKIAEVPRDEASKDIAPFEVEEVSKTGVSWAETREIATDSEVDKKETVERPLAFFLKIHFWVAFLRFVELLILATGILSAFAVIRTDLPPDLSTRLEFIHTAVEINIWQGTFCGKPMLAWNLVLPDPDHTFGRCSPNNVRNVKMGYMLALVAAVLALAFQKDAKKKPFFFLTGFVMHFLSMVKLGWSIGEFYAGVYPGRPEIDPSYCEMWTDIFQAGACSIQLGNGFILTCTALVLVFIGFVGELVAQRGATYGVRSAFDTLFGRVRRGRLKSLFKSTQDHEFSPPDKATLEEEAGAKGPSPDPVTEPAADEGNAAQS